MARLAIAKDFLADFARLEKHLQKAVQDAFDKFAQHTHAGLHLEPLNNSRDPRIRTIRINQQYRGVVLAPENGGEHLLLKVMNHDDAIAYAVSRRFTVNEAIGVLEVRDQEALEDIEPALRQAAEKTERRLFDDVSDSDLVRLGIDQAVLPLVRVLSTESHLDALAPLLPSPQHDALVALASGMTPEEAWAEVSKHMPTAEPPEHIDPTDLASAIERTPDQYVMVSGPEDLAEILAHPFAAWRIFLHPRQRSIAYRESYRGPALVTGGAGTGKTVTAVHRAAFLAERATTAEDEPRILVTTYTRNLAEALQGQLAMLVSDEVVESRIEASNVDRLAYQVITEAHGRQPDVADNDTMNRLWDQAAALIGGEFSPSFLWREWEQVILAQQIHDLPGYVECRRRGRGRGLNTAQRGRVWTAIGHVLAELRRSGQRTHHQIADEAARILNERAEKPYRHVIVDEGQDLHPAQWRLLRAAVAPGPDDLFIVADPNQRIYDHRVSLEALGIRVVGRSYKLTISYRTTQEILSWSVGVLNGNAATGLNDEPDTLAGYRSPMHGRRPVVRGFPSRAAELDALVDQVRVWLDSGVEPQAIAIAARFGWRVREARDALERAGIPTASSRAKDADGVRAGSMHSMKGLEFRCIAVIGVDEDDVPATKFLTSPEEDPVAHQQDLQRERCLLFVAATRARDMLAIFHQTGKASPFLKA
ncbi:UvrD-helicase domain-containing protein [Streptoalloteichus hindustanus]|uniref:DNA 3'-5' helicase n=1 Tax=Streptoalloteichus hindustanus TaxID=2017 RepID=A0A1M5LG21_STRHI|nr:UvrD-helicase domain-containing protein [Streptoalloteichus hindustanus]SHG63906.1 UvrD-like helicase C-terminal domain-containing protein [Streptoalloteichus hindustanus]